MYTDEVRVRHAPRSSHSQCQVTFPNKPHVSRNRWITPPCLFFFRRYVRGRIFYFQNHEVSIVAGRGLPSVLMLSNRRGKGSVGEGETGKNAKTTPDAGGKSVDTIFRSCGQGQTDWEQWS